MKSTKFTVQQDSTWNATKAAKISPPFSTREPLTIQVITPQNRAAVSSRNQVYSEGSKRNSREAILSNLKRDQSDSKEMVHNERKAHLWF